MPIAKPPSHPDWIITWDPTKMAEPSSAKKTLGFVSGEAPAFQSFNWFYWNIDQWIKYFENVTDILTGSYDIVIGTGTQATHATLDAAVADAAQGPSKRILILANASATLNSTIQLTKNDWRIDFAPGAVYTKGTANPALQVTATGVVIQSGRFVGWTGGTDKAIQYVAGADYGRVIFNRFGTGTTQDVDDSGVAAGRKPIQLGNIMEQ